MLNTNSTKPEAFPVTFKTDFVTLERNAQTYDLYLDVPIEKLEALVLAARPGKFPANRLRSIVNDIKAFPWARMWFVVVLAVLERNAFVYDDATESEAMRLHEEIAGEILETLGIAEESNIYRFETR